MDLVCSPPLLPKLHLDLLHMIYCSPIYVIIYLHVGYDLPYSHYKSKYIHRKWDFFMKKVEVYYLLARKVMRAFVNSKVWLKLHNALYEVKMVFNRSLIFILINLEIKNDEPFNSCHTSSMTRMENLFWIIILSISM